MGVQLRKHHLRPHFTTLDELEYCKNWRTRSWAHLNFLQVGKQIFVPQLEVASDNDAISQIKSVFCAEYDVVAVETKGIVRKGGTLNCITWNICK